MTRHKYCSFVYQFLTKGFLLLNPRNLIRLLHNDLCFIKRKYKYIHVHNDNLTSYIYTLNNCVQLMFAY